VFRLIFFIVFIPFVGVNGSMGIAATARRGLASVRIKTDRDTRSGGSGGRVVFVFFEAIDLSAPVEGLIRAKLGSRLLDVETRPR
jgi:hypothetical protein